MVAAYVPFQLPQAHMVEWLGAPSSFSNPEPVGLVSNSAVLVIATTMLHLVLRLI